MLKLNFAMKLTALILGIIFVSTLSLTWLIYTTTMEELTVEITENLKREARCGMDKIERSLFERWMDIQIVATDPIISSGNSTPEEISTRLREFRNRYQVYASFSFYDRERTRIADTAGLGLGEVEEGLWVKEVFDEGKVSAAADIRESREMGIAVIFFAAPVRDKEGRALGAVVSRMPLSRIYDLTRQILLGKERDFNLLVDLLDKDGLILYSNHNRKGILKLKSGHWEEDMRFFEGKKQGNKIDAYPGREEMIHVFVQEEGFLDFPGNDWTLEVHVPTRDAFAPAMELGKKVLALFAAIGAVAVLFALFFSRSFSAPLVRLKDAVLCIGRGEWDVGITSRSRDEVGELAQGLSRMLKDLKATSVGRNYLDSIIQSMADPLMVTDSHAVITTVNPAAAAILGSQKEEMLGRNVKDVFPGGLLCGYEFDDLIQEGVVSQRESLCFSRDGREIPVLFSSSVIRNQKNEIQGLVCLAVDITERKEAEEKIRRANEKLIKTMGELKTAQDLLVRQEKLASIGTLSAGVAHEILNPLNIIGATAQLLQMEETSQEKKEHLGEIMNQIHRATKITDNLRIFSRRRKAETRPLDVHALLEKTEDLLRHDLKLDNILVDGNWDERLPLIQGDEDHLVQIFLNLFTNARDAMKPRGGGILKIKTQRVEKGIQIHFRDTGPGMPESVIKEIFDPFFTTKEPGQGTGLGLSIVHNLVEGMGGRIAVESEEGKGTEFVITLPVKEG